MAKGLVVGIAGGTGFATAKALLSKGHTIAGTVMSAAEEDRVRREIPEILDLFQIDLRDADGTFKTLQQFVEHRVGGLDFVINCAGISPFGPLETTPLKELRQVLEINSISPVAIYQACLPALRRSLGRMVFVGSMAGKVGMPFIGHYVASKFALEGLIDVMRREAFIWGVGVSLVEPGGIKTPLVLREIEGLRTAICGLTRVEDQLYGELYRYFLRRLETSYDNCIDPDEVAWAIVEILEAPEIISRREVGPDAQRLCKASRIESDEEIDKMFRLSYMGALDRRVE